MIKSLLPLPWQPHAWAFRAGAYILIGAALFTTGLVKGRAWEQNIQAGEDNQALIAQLAQAELQARKDASASLKAIREKAALEARNRSLQGKLSDAVKSMPPCEIPRAAVDAINEMMKP